MPKSLSYSGFICIFTAMEEGVTGIPEISNFQYDEVEFMKKSLNLKI